MSTGDDRKTVSIKDSGLEWGMGVRRGLVGGDMGSCHVCSSLGYTHMNTLSNG